MTASFGPTDLAKGRTQVQAKLTTLKFLVQFLPIWLLLNGARVFPFPVRVRLFGAVLAAVATLVPPARRRAERNLALAFPDMSRGELRRTSIAVARNVGSTLCEILNNDLLAVEARKAEVSGPGLEVLKQAKAEGRGAIVISAHYGQWEAIRHVLMQEGMETGAVYKPNTNPFYERIFLTAIRKGGEPVVESGAAGMVQAIRHIKKGGFFAILPDQRFRKGTPLPFFGHPAWTSLVPADLALKYDIPLVPAYATRHRDGTIGIEFEAPIPHSTAAEMMQESLKGLEARIRAHPEQWYWYHNRW